MICTLTARRLNEEFGRDDQVSKVEPYVEEVLFEGSFEVVEEVCHSGA